MRSDIRFRRELKISQTALQNAIGRIHNNSTRLVTALNKAAAIVCSDPLSRIISRFEPPIPALHPVVIRVPLGHRCSC
ncbi:hypothetical protein VTI28DRAFT_5932 [Corynascus sepedonium]